MIRNAGIEPEVIEYLKTPPSKQTLTDMISAMGVAVREVMRKKETLYSELQLDDTKWSEDALIEKMLEHPILMNRPIVVTPLGTRLCRPSEEVLEILTSPQRGAFTKEDGEKVIDEQGRRL